MQGTDGNVLNAIAHNADVAEPWRKSRCQVITNNWVFHLHIDLLQGVEALKYPLHIDVTHLRIAIQIEALKGDHIGKGRPVNLGALIQISQAEGL